MIGEFQLAASKVDPSEWCERYAKGASSREEMMGHWMYLAKYIQPRKLGTFTGRGTGGPDPTAQADLFDSTGVEACAALARGQLSHMTPKQSPWFELVAPRRWSAVEEVKRWYSETTLGMREMFAESNFYTEIHELYLDRGGFGTSALYSDWDWSNDRLFFLVLPLGKFVPWENAYKLVDTVGIEHPLTARQVIQLFGPNLVSEKVRKMANDPKKKDSRVEILQFIYPRSEAEKGGAKMFSLNWDYASLWVEKDTKHVICEGGFFGNPIHVTRFLRWQGISPKMSVWGWGPGWGALPDLKQLNHLERQMDALAERMVSPPVLVPDTLEGRADLRPGGETRFNAAAGEAGIPRTWADTGRYDVGQERAETRRTRVKRHFMQDLFELLSQIEPGKMTMFETNARLQEKADMFSPTFDLVTTEVLSPVVLRSFYLGLRHGRFSPPPRQLIEFDQTGRATIPEPQVRYTSKIALAIAAASVRASEGVIADAAQLAAAGRPEVMDNFDLDEAVREKFRAQGGNPQILVDPGERDAKRRARAEQQMAMAQQQAMTQGAGKAPMVGNG